MNYSFHPDAETEFFEAIDYYEDCDEGLGLEFSREIFATIKRVVHFPLAWPPLSNRSRRCLCKRFPYGIVYRIAVEEIVIYAVMQLNREPGYWENRVK